MKKTLLFFVAFMLIFPLCKSQNTGLYDLGIGLRFQKTEGLYWENGIGADYTADFLLHKKIHLKLSYVTSRLGTALFENAIRQDNYLIGADWHFLSDKNFQPYVGLNTGFFHADMENPIFNVLPHNSLLLSAEAGLYYKINTPIAASLSVGYNFINGDGVNIPGTIFPVYYQLSVFYYFGKK